MAMWFDDALGTVLDELTDNWRLRRPRAMSSLGAHLILADGRALIDVSSNDYLGLSQHPFVKESAAAWTGRYGAGTRASRLVTGTLQAVVELEQRLAVFKGKEAALILNSGFQANATVLPALFELAAPHLPLVFTDRLNHASLHMGCRAAGVRQIRFRHNDLIHLEALLAEHTSRDQVARAFIVTESVFSMDGDCADIPALVKLAQRYNALLYLDEAHATGVLGPGGRGLAALAPDSSSVIMGTLGKALGGAGAYIAGSQKLIDYLINRCAGFVYSTALPPAAYGAASAALELIPAMASERTRLTMMADELRTRLHRRSIDTLQSSTQIIPAILGSEAAALAAQRQLEEIGILAVAIRPPTVPQGASRLRFALSSALTDEDFQRVVDAVSVLSKQ